MEGTTNNTGPGFVVVGVDGSDPACRAALWAAAEASRRDRPLHIVYGSDTDGRALYVSAESIEHVRQAGRELLGATADVVSGRFPGLSVDTEYSRSAPVPTLHRSAGLHGTIVVGNRGAGGFGSLLLGSVGLKVAAGARTPVIVVRGADNRTETGAVLAAVRDEHDLESALYAAREAELRNGSLRLLHVWNILQSVGNVVTLLDDVDQIAGLHVHHLNAVGEQVRQEFPDLTVRVDAEKSVSVAGVLVEASRHVDLLVMGGRRSPSYLGSTLGRTTHSLIHHAQCPVQLIPRTNHEHGSRS
ncbi:universal stress protein [Streptomyces sp. NBC_00654]|uniref:universal stress protein n=1 Tax=Streptomyces sp. NBC_00654 TaxID=2975799 RepID=UPI00224F17AB|nr:universal stress protein [Streptomyces sp. NBC_00654]MCX4966115.1 universal stress protein [Streptomyces sp. NBC_00654]